MRRILLIALALMGLNLAANHHLTAEQAAERVGIQVRSVKSMRQAKSVAGKPVNYYVFNRSEGGFVIASADDRARAILGRCDQGEFDADKMPPAMRGWLESMDEALAALAQQDDQQTEVGDNRQNIRRRAAATRVEPLLGDILWGQGEPYYNECPAVGNAHSATGCAATAMAQIMRYHKWPEKGAGSNSYTSETLKFEVSEDFSTTTYDWANMKPSYPISSDGKTRYYTETEAAAVARLMYHLGAATNMDYNTGASGTTEGPMIRAMLENFSYDKSLQIYYREYFTSPQWYALLQSEIDAKRPVLMNGYSISGGHAFVIDGYDTTMGQGYFHFNWGWNGMSNGYYSVDITDPGQQGTGGSLGGYSYNQNIFTGIQRPTSGSVAAQPNLCVSAALRYQYNQIHYQVLNRGCGSFTGEVGYVTEKGGSVTFTSVDSYTAMAFREGSGSKHVSIAQPTEAGVRVYLASRVGGVVKVLPTSVGSTAALISVLDRSTGQYTFVPEEKSLAKLSCSELKLQDGVAYAGTTVYFTIQVTNQGQTEYNGPLYLSITDIMADGTEGYEDRATDNPLGVYVRPGETVTCQFPYYGTPASGQYKAQLMSNPRNGGGLQYVDGAVLTFDVVPYSAPAAKNPPVLKVISQELSANTVEQGKTLTLKVKVNNTGGTDPVMAGGIIYQKKGAASKGYLGKELIAFPEGESEYSFASSVMAEPGEYRMLFGFASDGIFWEPVNYNYIYFTVTESTDPIDPVDPVDPIDPPGPNPPGPVNPPVGPDGPDGPEGTTVTLTLDDVLAYYYANSKFSQESHHYYFLNYGNLADEDGFPWLLFNIYQPTNQGLVEGTYSLADGTIGNMVILRSMEDYSNHMHGTVSHPLSEATVTLTNPEGNNWRMVLQATGLDGVKYEADVTLPIEKISTTQDETDPMSTGGGGNNPVDPTFAEVLDINYCEIELWTDPKMSPNHPGCYDYYFQMVHLQEGAQRADKWPFVDFDIYLPKKGELVAGTYKFNENFENFALIQNNEDEKAYENWEDNYGFIAGSVTLTHNGGNNWSIDILMNTIDGKAYAIHHTMDVTLRWRDEDPMDHVGVNDTFNGESTEATNHNIPFALVDSEYMSDKNFYYLNFESDNENEKGERYVGEFYFRTDRDEVPAGTYPFSYDDESTHTFVSSHGDGMSGGVYPSYIALYDGKRLTERWYLVGGSIKVTYGEEDGIEVPYFTGDVVSHYGSKLHFTTDPKQIEEGILFISGARVKKHGKVLRGRSIIINNEYDLEGKKIAN